MNLDKYKFATIFFSGVLLTSVILGCFIMGQNFSTMDMEQGTKSSECCGSNAFSFTNHLGPNTQYTLASGNLALIVINFILAVVIFLYIKSDTFANYYLIKDRYGGFKLFCKFTLLFKKGILHPKLY